MFMPDKSNAIAKRKKEHIELCLTDRVTFKDKSNGFDKYDFVHYAITEVVSDEIILKRKFFKKEINYPFLISCMTGGSDKSEDINARLAAAAQNLKIPLGVGSQRQALVNPKFNSSYKIIRRNAPSIPILGNIGAAQVVKFDDAKPVKKLADLIEADAMVIHVNPLQELIQDKGEPYFKGLLKIIEKIAKNINIPLIVKEVGAGISKEAAERLLNAGVKGIDVAGAGGTSWAGVEILRNNWDDKNYFWDWGLPTSYCIGTVNTLKKKHSFLLIGSGGINNPVDAAKALALGADIVASARVILQRLDKSGPEGVVQMLTGWSEVIKDIMFLTGAKNLKEFKKNKLIRKEQLY